jgi:pyridoxal phosphate-dependent aminotransferase EpsN
MDTNKRIYLSPPHMSGLEQQFMAEAFETNWIAPLGPNVDAFEREVAELVGTRGAVALSSGTAAIHLALRLLGVTAGDIVFCSTLTFVASANPILYLGAKPVFIDSDPETWNMSPAALARAFEDAERNGRLPKAVVVVNLYGQSADYDKIGRICNKYGVPVVEDAAESLGATYKGKMSGSIGKYGIFSFNGNKIITTSGGGMLVSDDPEGLDKARFWATQARDPAPHYQHSEMGYNYRMSNVLAGIGRGQLRVLRERVEARRRIFERYRELLKDEPTVSFMPEADFGRSTRWLTVMLLDPGISGKLKPADLVRHLETYNIESRPLWKPLHLQPLFADAPYYPHTADRDVSAELFARGVCLPSGSALTEEEQERVGDCVREWLHAAVTVR